MNFNKRLREAEERFYTGLIALSKAEYQKALEESLKAAELFKEIKGEELNYSRAIGNVAIVLYKLGEYEKAANYFEEQFAELNKLNNEQRIEIERLKKLEYLSAMATGISHSINNPVGLVNLAAQRGLRKLAKNKLTHEETTEIFKEILNQISRLHNITSGFRKFANGDRSTIENVNLNDLVQQIQEYFTNQLNNHKINLIVELSPTHPCCQANYFILQEALINLLTNAREALEHEKIPNAKIWLKTYQQAEKVGIIVEDNGTGITEAQQRNLFTPFHSSKAHGMGLGLYFAHKSLAAINGALSYQNRTPNGACFTIEFNGENHEN